MTVTGEKAGVGGRKPLLVQAGNQELVHNSQCTIISLDLLTCWGAHVDMSGAAITLSTETVAFQSAQGEKVKGIVDAYPIRLSHQHIIGAVVRIVSTLF